MISRLACTATFVLGSLACALPAPASAQGQQLSPQQQRALSEAQNLFFATRLAAPCAGLITDWELEVANFYRDRAAEAVMGEDKSLPARMVREIYSRADAAGCINPQVAERVQELRDFVHRRWLVATKAWGQAADCPTMRNEKFHTALVADLETRLSSQRPAVVANLEAEVSGFAGQLNAECQKASPFTWQSFGLFGDGKAAAKLRNVVEAPGKWMKDLGYTDNGRGVRYFDLTLGWTLGEGETQDRAVSRASWVTARRASLSSTGSVQLGTACGGWFNSPKTKTRLQMNCSYLLDSKGTLKAYSQGTRAPSVEATMRAMAEGKDPNPDGWWALGAEIRIIDPSGAIVERIQPDEGTKFTFSNVLAKLNQHNRGFQFQIAITEPSAQSNGTSTKFIAYDFAKNASGEKTVTIQDIIKAANYAFSPTDLSRTSPEFALALENGVFTESELGILKKN